jgi:hypothetical protein
MKGQDAERLAGVLAQCTAPAHLDLSDNSDFGADGVGSIAGALGHCRELVHLNLSDNNIEAAGCRSAGQYAALAHLNLSAQWALAMLGQRVLGECWLSAECWFGSISTSVAESEVNL